MKRNATLRSAGLLVTAAVFVFSSAAVSAMPAAAMVYNCTTGFNGNGWAYAQCLNADNPSTDQYRVAVLCRNAFWQSHVVYGS